MKKYLVIFSLFISQASLAYVDLNLSYTHSVRKVEGVVTTLEPEPGSAISTTDGYIVNWAWYMWEYTALELNYSRTSQRMQDDREFQTSDSSITIKKQDSTVITEVSGVGIRQSFANRKAAIIPSLSIGYAKYTTSGTTKYTLDVSGTEYSIESEQDKEVFSSSYASFSLRFQFTQLVGLTLSAKTVMPDFETKEAENNMTYAAGFSWIF